jgi:hypothetical protein
LNWLRFTCFREKRARLGAVGPPRQVPALCSFFHIPGRQGYPRSAFHASAMASHRPLHTPRLTILPADTARWSFDQQS